MAMMMRAAKRRRLNTCSHDRISDEKLCLRCGMSIVDLNYISQDFSLSIEQIVEYRRIDLKKKIEKKKLYLVLDLDHTLLHTINIEDSNSDEMEEILATDNLQNNFFFIEDLEMVTKLRPFLFDFLKQAGELFQLCIYTMGCRKYAKRMTNLIDPDSKMFEWRIISCEDCTVMGKKGLDVVLADEKAVLIVDDTLSVWSNHERNLINVDSFYFFGEVRFMKEKEAEDDELSKTLYLLKKVHAMFFDPEIDTTLVMDRDVRDYLNLARMEFEVDDEAEEEGQ